MYQDKELMFSIAQDDVRAADTWESDNALDLLSAPPRQIGDGEQVNVFAQVVTAFAGGTSVQFQLVEADNAALTSNPVVLIQTPAIVTASLVAGYAVNLAVPIKRLAKRYLGLRYVSVGVHSAGSITAGIYRDHQTNDAGFDADDGWS